MILTINKALQLLLKLDPQASALLNPLNNKSLSVYITDLDYRVTLDIKDNSISASNDQGSNELSGKLAYIIELVFNKNMQELIMAEKINFEGSLKELNEFNKFFNAIDIDLVYEVSRRTSPEFASIISKPFEKAKQYLITSRKETIIDIKDYLTEEKKILISKNEINIFYKEVRELKQAADRIEAKLNLLQGS